MPDAHPLRAGDPARLGAYELLGRLGEGGQGSVFLGRAVPEGEHVAIKLLHAGLTADPAARGRFVRELEVAKRVARFCTAQILDADVAGDQPYIVSEFVPGSSLHRLVLAEGPRGGGALERLAISTLTALTAIHQAGIVHRDFKPHNVMLGPDGPRVIDFGVARALGAAGETQNVGTPAYMAPEHFNGGAVGPAADMFAWGTTMVFAATGQPAFGNDEMGAVMNRILTAEPDLRGLPEPLRDVVAACLVKDPARRPTARDAQERLVGAGAAPWPMARPWPDVASPAELLSPPGSFAQTAPQQKGPPKQGKPAWLVPLLVAASVGVLLVGGGLVWAATGAGGNGEDGQSAEAAEVPGEQTQGGPRQPGGAPGVAPSDKRQSPPSASARPSAGRSPDRHAPKPGKKQKPGPGGGGGSTSEPPNPYSPQQVCNSGGHGGGYYVQRSTAFSGGTAFQLYNGSGYNCSVTIKTKSVGKKTSVWTRMERKDGKGSGDSGPFEYYAGPSFVYGKGQCVRYAGGVPSGSTTASWDNCG